MTKTEPTLQEIADLRAAASIQHVLPEILSEIEAMEQSTRTQVFGKLRAGTLTPQEALAYWMEVFSYQRLRTKMTSKAELANKITETRSITNG
jgi:hypothetical protein